MVWTRVNSKWFVVVFHHKGIRWQPRTLSDRRLTTTERLFRVHNAELNVEFVALGYCGGQSINEFNKRSDSFPESIWGYQTQQACATLSSGTSSNASCCKGRRPFPIRSPQTSSAVHQQHSRLCGSMAWLRTVRFCWLSHSFVNKQTEQLPLKWTAGPHPATQNTYTTTWCS